MVKYFVELQVFSCFCFFLLRSKNASKHGEELEVKKNEIQQSILEINEKLKNVSKEKSEKQSMISEALK